MGHSSVLNRCCKMMAGIGLSLLAAATAQAEPVFLEAGKLTYGVNATFAPFEFQKGDSLVGLDIDLGEEIAKRLNRTASPMNMEFQGLIPALLGKRIDFINSAVYINPERAAQVDFIPYLRLGNQLVVRQGNPQKITGRNETLCGKILAVTLGSVQEQYAKADNERCKSGGKPELTLNSYPTNQVTALTLRQGRADALYDSVPGVVNLLQSVPDTYEVAGEPFDNDTQLGFAVRKGDDAMRKELTDALKKLVADGTYRALVEKWRLPETTLLPID